ncbi:glycosyltransferase family 2 protein [candidate division WOR-3 bacterium]|nr:glycosyltransferase family 2 protein [candidate division WOR-3 bacterium]
MNIILSIIIPNWNGKKYLRVCLNSLRRQTLKDFEVILVDNGSKDGSVEFLKRRYPEVMIISLPKNYGFSKAINIGIKQARGEYIAILNNDTEADKDWLLNSIDVIRRNPDSGFCASLVLNYFDRDIIDTAGDCYAKTGVPFKRGMEEKFSEEFGYERQVFGASGCAAVYKREIFDRLGLFDENFFAYFEDVDFSFRANLLGIKCIYNPSAIVYHIEGASTRPILKRYTRRGLDTKEKTYLIARNKIYIIIKNLPLSLIVKYFPNILFGLLKHASYHFRKSGYFVYFFLGTFAGIAGIGKFLRKRKKVQRERKVSIQEIETLIKFH